MLGLEYVFTPVPLHQYTTGLAQTKIQKLSSPILPTKSATSNQGKNAKYFNILEEGQITTNKLRLFSN